MTTGLTGDDALFPLGFKREIVTYNLHPHF